MQTGLNVVNINLGSSPEYLSAIDNLTLPRHRWYFFKEAFSPRIVDRAILDSLQGKTELVVDPFSGSGTVPLAATLKGYEAIGLEVNPFLAFVSSVKLSRCRSVTVEKHIRDIVSGCQQGMVSPLESFSTFGESGRGDRWLFNRDVLTAFEGGWQATIPIHGSVQSVIRLALLGAAMDACNAEKDGKCLRYRSDWKEKRYSKTDFITAFETRIFQIREDLERCPLDARHSKVRLADARSPNAWKLLNRNFQLCVMSPPYLNSFDYTDVYRPELFLGKFVRTPKQLQDLRLRTLRSHVQAKWPKPVDRDFGHHFSQSFARLNEQAETLWDSRLPTMVQAYFEDMKRLLSLLREHAAVAARIWIVVSTSAYAGVEIPVDFIIADIGQQIGWKVREVNVMRYLRRVSGQQWNKLYEAKNKRPHLRESLIILDRI